MKSNPIYNDGINTITLYLSQQLLEPITLKTSPFIQ